MQQARQLSQPNRLISRPQPGRGAEIKTQPAVRLKKVKFILILVTCFLLSLVVVGQYSSLVILNYRLGSVRTELSVARETSRGLELEAAQLSSLERIDQIAREDLGMVEPDMSQMRIITAGR